MSYGHAEAPQRDDSRYLAHIEADGRCQTLQDHLIGVSESASRLSDKLGLASAGSLIGLLHDLGKYSNDFQQYLRRVARASDGGKKDPERGKIDHATAGAQKVWRELRQNTPLPDIASEILAICIASHHSGLIDCIAPNGTDNLLRRMEKADSASHYEEACRKAEGPILETARHLLGDPELIGAIEKKLHEIDAENVDGNTRAFKTGLLIRMLFSCLIDADRTNTAEASKPAQSGLRQHGNYVHWDVLAQRLNRRLEEFREDTAIDKLRREISDDCAVGANRSKGIFTLTVPTGGGKTLASLRFGLDHAKRHGMQRVVYVSPYISIIDQNADVVRKILEPDGCEFASVVLEHHSNLTPLKETAKSKLLSENWDAPVVFTTAVQLLEALFGSGTRAVRRMHQLANAVLIFDEVQTLPVRCVHLFNNAMNFLVEHCGASVLLCTATQPLLHEVDPRKGAMKLSEHAELMGDLDALFASFRRCATYDRRQPGGWEHPEIGKLAVAQAAETGSCLVVVNTKSEARLIFQQCKEKAPEAALYHLSTNMCPAHRMKVLGEIKDRLPERGMREERPVICVSTQLIEAGVDIDFGSVIRALAGLDSVAQAAGRCNRHGTRPLKGRVHLVNVAGELPSALTEMRAGQQAAQRVLDERTGAADTREIDLSDTSLIEQYFRYYFFDRKKEMSYRVEIDRRDNLLNMLGENVMAVAESGRLNKNGTRIFLKQSFMAAANAFQAIDGKTQGIIVPYGTDGKAVIAELCSAYQIEKQFKLLKRAQQFAVNVFPKVMGKLQRAQAVREVQPDTGILYLDEKYYSAEFGLAPRGMEEMEFLDE